MTTTVNPEDCYYQLSIKSTIRKEVLSIALNTTDWESATHNGKFSFMQIVIPKQVYIGKDPVLSLLAKHYEFTVRVFKMPADTYYALHTDGWRGSSLNMLLNEPDQHAGVTFFDAGWFRRGQLHTINVPYDNDCYTLLNTQIRHGVLNPKFDRYALVVGLGMFEPEQREQVEADSMFQKFKKEFIELGL